MKKCQVCLRITETTLFWFLCLSSRRRTLQHYARGRSSYFNGSHVPIKRELFMHVEVPILTGSPKVREQLGLMTSGGPPLGEPTC